MNWGFPYRARKFPFSSVYNSFPKWRAVRGRTEAPFHQKKNISRPCPFIIHSSLSIHSSTHHPPIHPSLSLYSFMTQTWGQVRKDLLKAEIKSKQRGPEGVIERKTLTRHNHPPKGTSVKTMCWGFCVSADVWRGRKLKPSQGLRDVTTQLWADSRMHFTHVLSPVKGWDRQGKPNSLGRRGGLRGGRGLSPELNSHKDGKEVLGTKHVTGPQALKHTISPSN